MKNQYHSKAFFLLALSLMLLSSANAQQFVIKLDTNGNLIQYYDSCCEHITMPDNEIEGYYVLGYSDTVFFENYRNIFAPFNFGSNYVNPIQFYRVQSFGIPINGHLYLYHFDKDSCINTFDGIVKDGFYFSGVFIDYYPDGTIKSTTQVEDGWLTGIHTAYFPNGRVQLIEKYIIEFTHPVAEWEYDSTGILIEFYNEEKLRMDHFENGY